MARGRAAARSDYRSGARGSGPVRHAPHCCCDRRATLAEDSRRCVVWFRGPFRVRNAGTPVPSRNRMGAPSPASEVTATSPCCAAQRMLCRSDVLTVRSGLLPPIAPAARGPESARGVASTRQVRTTAGAAAHLRATPRLRRIRRRSPPAQRRVQCAAAKSKSGRGARESGAVSQPGRAGDAHACRPCAAAAFAAEPHLGFAHVGGLLRASRERHAAGFRRGQAACTRRVTSKSSSPRTGTYCVMFASATRRGLGAPPEARAGSDAAQRRSSGGRSAKSPLRRFLRRRHMWTLTAVVCLRVNCCWTCVAHTRVSSLLRQARRACGARRVRRLNCVNRSRTLGSNHASVACRGRGGTRRDRKRCCLPCCARRQREARVHVLLVVATHAECRCAGPPALPAGRHAAARRPLHIAAVCEIHGSGSAHVLHTREHDV